MLKRAVERRQEANSEPFELDPRTCADLRAEVLEAAKCKDRFVCEDQVKRVALYRDRCESALDRPTIATAVAEAIVVAGSGKPIEPILVQPDPQIQPDELPIVLEDHLGAVITVCEERASDLPRYLASRKSCQGGRMVVAHAFPTTRGVEVRVGAFDFPNDATFSARYPTIVATREIQLRDAEGATALESDLKAAVALSRTNVAQALRELLKAANENALVLRRASAAKAVLERYDANLAPVLRELARTKLAALRGRVAPGDVAALVGRGVTRAFADMTAEGTVRVGAFTQAGSLDTTTLLPKAMGPYLELMKSARRRGGDRHLEQAEKARGLTAAAACGAAMKRLKESKTSLFACNFGLEVCDDAKQAELAKAVDAARVDAETAYQTLDGARVGAAASEASSLTQAADSAGCREPWW